MWDCRCEPMGRPDLLTVSMRCDGEEASFGRVLEAWQCDAVARKSFASVLASSPYGGFRWECPPLTEATIDRTFECVLVESEGLDRAPDAGAFAEFFAQAGKASVVSFPSLRRDAQLIAPCPQGEPGIYTHLASFLRGAPEAQVDELWMRVGTEVAARVSGEPLWLSTAGMGVAWLHVRLDSRPKYYWHRPYMAAP